MWCDLLDVASRWAPWDRLEKEVERGSSLPSERMCADVLAADDCGRWLQRVQSSTSAFVGCGYSAWQAGVVAEKLSVISGHITVVSRLPHDCSVAWHAVLPQGACDDVGQCVTRLTGFMRQFMLKDVDSKTVVSTKVMGYARESAPPEREPPEVGFVHGQFTQKAVERTLWHLRPRSCRRQSL